MSDLQTMTWAQFRDSGLLQEVNRRLLHPLGVALSVTVDDDSGKVLGPGPIWDYRNDPEGLRFSAEELDADTASAARAIDHFWAEATRQRTERFGWVVQPIPGAE